MIAIGLNSNSLRASLYELRLGELRASQAPAELASSAVERFTTHDPHNPEAWRSSAETSLVPEKAISDARQSVRLGPARARGWLLLSWRLIGSGRSGKDLDRALQQAGRLAPSDRPLQISLALMGLQYWAVGSDSAQQVWQTALRHSLQYDADELKRQAAARNLGAALCLGFVDRYDLDPWCQQQMTHPASRR